MKRIAISILAGAAIAAVVINFSCKKKDNNTVAGAGFDRKAMLTNIGNNIILPGYKTLQAKMTTFDSCVTSLTNAPSGSAIVQAQVALKDLYMAWQACSPFEVGAADQASLNLNVNTFPTDTAKINSNIKLGSLDVTTAANNAAKGLPAADYLLFHADASTLFNSFTTGDNALNRRKYLAAITTELKKDIDNAANPWITGSYVNTFVVADGTDVGSSAGILINKMDYDMEGLKNYKLGIPLGKQSMGELFPAKVEAYYSGISAQLALLQLQAIQNLYLGKSAQGDGQGFDDYLAQANAKYNGGSLNDTIKAEFVTAIAALQTVSDPLSAAITTDPTAANAAYRETQKLVVLLKTDMPSALGVLITYADNDGD